MPASPPRRRSAVVVASGTAAFAVAAMGLTACSSPDPDYQGVCVDQTTNTRVRDEDCSSGGGGHGFVYYGSGRSYPPVGSSVSSYPGYETSVPDGHVGVKGGASSSGGTASVSEAKSAVSRGGFGTEGRGGSVGG